MQQAFRPLLAMSSLNPGHRRVLALVCFIAMCMFAAVSALGQSSDLRSGGLNPFPKDDIYRLRFLGDWFVEGLRPALKSRLASLPRVQVQNDKIEIVSLRRSNWNSRVAAIRGSSKSTSIDMAVVMFGVGEVGSVFTSGRERQRFGTEPWLKRYAARVDAVMKALKASKGAVYWIGLPVVRRRDHSEAYQVINTIFRERAYANSVTYIDTFSRFQNENGGFDRYGPGLDGTIKLMRSKDGIYFTQSGYLKIAHLVMQMIRRDLNGARSERVVTLAGSETEQSSIQRRRPSNRKETEQKAAAGGKRSEQTAESGGLHDGARFGAQKSDDGQYEFVRLVGNKRTKVVLKLPRPALSSAIMTLVTRNRSKNKPDQFGDNAVQVIDGGVPLLSTVIPENQNSLALRQRRLSPTQSVFFKVWGKGERLDPKPGRADDFQWPRPEPTPVVHVSAKPVAKVPRRRPRRDPNLPPLPEQNPYR